MSEKIKIEDGIISFFEQGTIFIEIGSSVAVPHSPLTSVVKI